MKSLRFFELLDFYNKSVTSEEFWIVCFETGETKLTVYCSRFIFYPDLKPCSCDFITGGLLISSLKGEMVVVLTARAESSQRMPDSTLNPLEDGGENKGWEFLLTLFSYYGRNSS